MTKDMRCGTPLKKGKRERRHDCDPRKDASERRCESESLGRVCCGGGARRNRSLRRARGRGGCIRYLNAIVHIQVPRPVRPFLQLAPAARRRRIRDTHLNRNHLRRAGGDRGHDAVRAVGRCCVGCASPCERPRLSVDTDAVREVAGGEGHGDGVSCVEIWQGAREQLTSERICHATDATDCVEAALAATPLRLRGGIAGRNDRDPLADPGYFSGVDTGPDILARGSGGVGGSSSGGVRVIIGMCCRFVGRCGVSIACRGIFSEKITHWCVWASSVWA
ncbi:hypothetical protein B0H13DRAFT_2006281 [Mycena leptocephala]|nr:hypothetical protein B0H13DRAFT_2006281 [Mycena leptocephala]